MAWGKEGWQAVVTTLMKGRIPESVENFLTSWGNCHLKKDCVPWSIKEINP